jgi:hypothetical protein
MKPKAKTLSDEDLILEFLDCAATRRNAILDGDNRLAIRSAYRMRDLDKIFSERGPAAQSLLMHHLDNPNEGVRFWAAMRLWPVTPLKARAVMEQIAEEPSPIGAEARGTLREISSGQFKPERLWAPRDIAKA